MNEYLAADLLVDSLGQHGVERVFCVPGESYLSVLNSLAVKQTVEVITARHESGAGFMALADAKLSGRPGVCFVSRGPGATNASIAIHSAQQDALPLVVFVGQVARCDLGRGAFQEVDYVRAWSGIAKWVWQVSDAKQLGEVIARAFQIAASPTPGPVVIALPEDMLEDMVPHASLTPPLPLPQLGVDAELCKQALDMILSAKRPLIIAGQTLNTHKGRAALEALASRLDVPVAVTFRQQDLLPNNHPCYGGHLFFNAPKSLIKMLDEADLLVAIGTRLGDVATQGYTFPSAPVPTQQVIHVHPDPSQLGRNYAVDLAIAADPAGFCSGVVEKISADAPRYTTWRTRVSGFVRELNAWTPKAADDGVVFGEVVVELDKQLADDAMVCLDAGNFSGWVQKHFNFRAERKMVATISGAMGSGVPSGVAASLRYPRRQVVVVVGDGGFMMTGAELATACQYGAPVKIIISDNGSYGTIRLHQETRYPGRISATNLSNPDFAGLARAYGAAGYEITQASEVEPVLRKALAEPGPAVVCVKTSLEHIAAFVSLTDIAKRQKKN
jgi:acetolactate synthase-1/2/3 large subunit